jgi:hypothetical protein
VLAPEREGLHSKARCHLELTGWHLTLPDPDQTLLARAHHAKQAPWGTVARTLAQFTTACSKQCRGNALTSESINRLVIHGELQRRAAPHGPIGPQGPIRTRKGVRHKNNSKKSSFRFARVCVSIKVDDIDFTVYITYMKFIFLKKSDVL